VTGAEVITENFLPEVRKMLPRSRRQHFTNQWQKIFNDDRWHQSLFVLLYLKKQKQNI